MKSRHSSSELASCMQPRTNSAFSGPSAPMARSPSRSHSPWSSRSAHSGSASCSSWSRWATRGPTSPRGRPPAAWGRPCPPAGARHARSRVPQRCVWTGPGAQPPWPAGPTGTVGRGRGGRARGGRPRSRGGGAADRAGGPGDPRERPRDRRRRLRPSGPCRGSAANSRRKTRWTRTMSCGLQAISLNTSSRRSRLGPAGDVEHLPGDEARRLADEEGHGVRDVLRQARLGRPGFALPERAT